MKSHPSRSPKTSPLLLSAALLVVGGLGTVATLWAAGKISLPFLDSKPEQQQPTGPPPGSIAVPISAQTIPAYTKITRDHLWNGQKKQFAVVYIPKEQIHESMLVNRSQIIGRVLDHDKPLGYAFTEKDFLPVGTRPGRAAGIPSDTHRGMVFEANRIQGVHSLRAGDHIDLLAGFPEDKKGRRSANSRLPGASMVLTPGSVTSNPSGNAHIEVVAQDALVITGVTTRLAPITSSSLTGGTKTKTQPVQEITIAVHIEDLTAVAKALALDATLTCVVRTNRPVEKRERIQLEKPEEPEPTVIETIRGTKRELLVFPDEGGTPRITPVPGGETPADTTVAHSPDEE